VKVRPIRWWRDDETRYMSRDEYRSHIGAARFDLAKVPLMDPLLDERVRWWIKHGRKMEFVEPVPFERLEPCDPIADIRVHFPDGFQEPKPFFALCRVV
jgi:hypothetical protein